MLSPQQKKVLIRKRICFAPQDALDLGSTSLIGEVEKPLSARVVKEV